MIRRQKNSGFTLAEIILSLAILGVLMSIVLPRFSGKTGQAKIQAARLQIENMALALDAFEFDTGRFPTSTEGLTALRTAPPRSEGWSGPYLKKTIPTDPWERPYVYFRPGRRGSDYDLFSLGPDGREGGADDIGFW